LKRSAAVRLVGAPAVLQLSKPTVEDVGATDAMVGSVFTVDLATIAPKLSNVARVGFRRIPLGIDCFPHRGTRRGREYTDNQAL